MTAATNTPARRVDITRPPATFGDLRQMLEQSSGAMAQVLPRHLTPERMMKLVLIAANRTPKLMDCKGTTIIESVMRAAELGLDCSGTLGEAYLVPYRDTCTLIVGYKGLAKLARQSGDVKRIEVEIVYDNDTFEYRKGANFVLNFTPNLAGDRGMMIGAYALVEFKDGGIQSDYMSLAEIDQIRKASQGANHGPWNDHFPEMSRKTVFRRLAKWLPLSSEKYDKALAIDNDNYDFGTTHVQDMKRGAAALNAAIEQTSAPVDDPADDPPTAKGDRLHGTSDDSEQADQPTTDEPQTWLDAVNVLMSNADVDSDTAEQVIADAVHKKWKKDVSELTAKQTETLIKAVADGDITA